MKPKTYHEGAAEERRQLLRKLRRDIRRTKEGTPMRDYLRELIGWVNCRHLRYVERKGGL